MFRDASAGQSFLTNATCTSSTTMTWEDGKEYPVVDVEASSASRPFHTGRAAVRDAAGQVARFRQRYGRAAVLTA